LGVNLTPIIVRRVVKLPFLRARLLAVDAFNVLHQFLALIRTREGKPLTDNQGRITSHLVGLIYRTTRLITDYQIRLAFIFDGEPPGLKKAEIEKRRNLRRQAEIEYVEALEKGDYETAHSKAVQTGRLTSSMIEDTKKILDYLGIPWIQAPGEGEAQAAHMAKKGDVWAVSSRDYDSLLFGSPRLVRYLTISGEEWLPSKGVSRKLEPEIITLASFLEHHEITLGQLVDMAILIGTDFNEGVRGIGPKTALKLVKKHGNIEEIPESILPLLPPNTDEIRSIYLKPNVSDEYQLNFGQLREKELLEFLCQERAFSRNRVEKLVERLKKTSVQRSLMDWAKKG
jgi:flap endonuclease-1